MPWRTQMQEAAADKHFRQDYGSELHEDENDRIGLRNAATHSAGAPIPPRHDIGLEVRFLTRLSGGMDVES